MKNFLLTFLMVMMPLLAGATSQIELSTTTQNIGIGTSQPQALLDVTGAVNAVSVTTQNPTHGLISTVGFGMTPGSAAKTFFFYPSGDIQINPVGISTVDPNETLDVQGTIQITAPSSSKPALLIPTGNVGIGSPNPQQMLDIQGTIRALGLTMTGNNAQNGYYLQSTDSAGDTTWATVSAGSSQWTGTSPGPIYYATGNVGVGSTNPGQSVDVQGTIRVTSPGTTKPALLVSTGNVGIGSALPGSLLDVQGSIRMLGSQASVSIGTSSVAKALNIGSGTNNMTVDSSGNTSIGTGNLVVGGNVQTPVIEGGTASNSNIIIKSSSSGGTDFIKLSTGSTTTVRQWIDTNGNIGIGTLAPVQPFVIGTDAAAITVSTIVCIGSNNCLGTCTGTITGDICTTCTCLPK